VTKGLYQLNLRLNVTSETTASRSIYSDLSYSKAIEELRGAKYCISTARALAIAAIDSIEKRPAKVTKKLAAVVERWVDWNHLYEKRFWKRADGTVDDDWFYHHTRTGSTTTSSTQTPG
jgi:hypothetical protein